MSLIYIQSSSHRRPLSHDRLANFLAVSAPLIIAYPAEIWPYRLRARGMALTQVSLYVAIFFNIFVNPIALDHIGWKYYIIFAVVIVVMTIIIYFIYPETRGHSLEEMASIFDGEAAAVTGKTSLKNTTEATGTH